MQTYASTSTCNVEHESFNVDSLWRLKEFQQLNFDFFDVWVSFYFKKKFSGTWLTNRYYFINIQDKCLIDFHLKTILCKWCERWAHFLTNWNDFSMNNFIVVSALFFSSWKKRSENKNTLIQLWTYECEAFRVKCVASRQFHTLLLMAFNLMCSTIIHCMSYLLPSRSD